MAIILNKPNKIAHEEEIAKLHPQEEQMLHNIAFFRPNRCKILKHSPFFADNFINLDVN